MLESKITKQIRDYLKAHGVKTIKLHGGPMAEAGLPDLLAIVNGLAVFIEVKQPGKRPTKLQLAKIVELRDSGAMCIVATSVKEVECILDLEWQTVAARKFAARIDHLPGRTF